MISSIVALWAISVFRCLAALASQPPAPPGAEYGKLQGNVTLYSVAYTPEWRPAVPGIAPLIWGLHNPAKIGKKACLSNGTDYCFTDRVKYCSGCGICCEGSKDYCCASDQQCCGDACCTSGQTCSRGQCYLPAKVTTLTSTVLIKVSHVATQTETVSEITGTTSTLFSTVEVTSTRVATTTSTTVVIVSTLARRGFLSDAVPKRLGYNETIQDRNSLLSVEPRGLEGDSSVSHTAKGIISLSKPPLGRRDEQPTADTADPIASTSLVTFFLTQTVDETGRASATVTISSTSIVLTTEIHTRTRVQYIRATIATTSTSTLLVTSGSVTSSPVTLSQSTQGNPSTSHAPLSISSAKPSSAGTSPSGLSKKTVIAIATATAAAVTGTVLVFSIFFYRRRDRPRHDRAPLRPALFDGPDAAHHADPPVLPAPPRILNPFSTRASTPAASPMSSPTRFPHSAFHPQLAPQPEWIAELEPESHRHLVAEMPVDPITGAAAAEDSAKDAAPTAITELDAGDMALRPNADASAAEKAEVDIKADVNANADAGAGAGADANAKANLDAEANGDAEKTNGSAGNI